MGNMYAIAFIIFRSLIVLIDYMGLLFLCPFIYPTHHTTCLTQRVALGPTHTPTALSLHWPIGRKQTTFAWVSVYRQAEPRHKESRNFRTTPTRVISIAGRDGVESGDSDSVDNG